MPQPTHRQHLRNVPARRSITGPGLVLTLAIALAGCASGPGNISDGRDERMRDAAQSQATADAIRRDGGSAAARQAQDRADRLDAEARRRPTGFVDWLLDVAINSWLSSGTTPSGRSR